jgi:hypothetical protein
MSARPCEGPEKAVSYGLREVKKVANNFNSSPDRHRNSNSNIVSPKRGDDSRESRSIIRGSSWAASTRASCTEHNTAARTAPLNDGGNSLQPHSGVRGQFSPAAAGSINQPLPLLSLERKFGSNRQSRPQLFLSRGFHQRDDHLTRIISPWSTTAPATW